MVSKNRESASGFEHAECPFEQSAEHIHFVVHLNAQRLKHLGQVLFLSFFRYEWMDTRQQIDNLCQRLGASRLDDGRSQPPRIFQFAEKLEDASQLLLLIRVEHIGGGVSAACVHAHVERRVKSERKSACFVVEVVARHAQIGQNAVHPLDFTVIAHPVGEETEVGGHKGEPLVFGHVVSRVGILIEAIKPTFCPEASENFAAVTASAESGVDIRAVRAHIEAVDGLAEQHRNVISGTERGHVVRFTI